MGKEIKSRAVAKNNKGKLTLSLAEKLLLWRRRKQWNQNEAAKFYGVAYVTYNFAESGKIKDFPYKEVDLLPLLDHEKCFVLRRRSGKMQEEIAAEINCSVYWLRLQELGRVSASKLLTYWENKNNK